MNIKLPFICYNSEMNAFRIGPAKAQWIEVWWRSGDWYKPSEWGMLGVSRTCGNGCTQIDCWWWGFTILRGECKEWDL